MNTLTEMSDQEFVPFLQSLGAETYKKSFEWMLSDRDFAGVLRWLYKSLDHNNALNAREEFRYLELEKKDQLKSSQDLQDSISHIQEQYKGIYLPGELEAIEDVKLDISMMQERLTLLEKQESVLKDLERQNKLIKEELNLEITKLNSSHQQCLEDEQTAAQECIGLAQQVENITDSVTSVIADNLELYASCHTDKEIARKFFTFGPFENYRQSQALFRSHFDLYASKKFSKRHNDVVSDEEVRSALIEARSMEERLSDAICAYVESKAELSGEHAKLALVADYNNVHPNQVAACLLEAQSGLELVEQEESILEQQLQAASNQIAAARTALAVDTTARAALALREQIHSDLAHLLDTTQQAFLLDRVLYIALRHELRTIENCLQFAADLRRHVLAETEAVHNRIESMNEICVEREKCEENQQTTDQFLHTLNMLLNAGPGNDPLVLVKSHTDIKEHIQELKRDLSEGYRRKEDLLDNFRNSTKDLRDYIWDGCTKLPNCRDKTVAVLTHTLRQNIADIEAKVLDATNKFATVKNGDKQCLRKLWQWFLTDPGRLLSALKNAQCRTY